IEAGRPLSEYDVVAFSLPYEGGYPRVPHMLMRGGVEPLSERRPRGPLVIAGGAAASANPEPIADFLDAVVVGEAEAAIEPLLDVLIAARLDPSRKRKAPLSFESLRDDLRGLPGVYLPSDYRHTYGSDGMLEGIEPMPGAPDRIEAARPARIDEPAHSPVISDRSAFPNRFLVEAARGCPYRCRFCLAGHTGGSFRPAKGIEETVRRGLEVTPKVGLIGTAFTRAARIAKVCELVAEAGGSLSFSSIRVDAGSLELLEKVGPALDIES
ncbi:unnamed protein product, partial [marine sediment metagenome]